MYHTSHENEQVEINRDCDGLIIPSAIPLNIPAGTVVQIVQKLGGNYTVLAGGNLVRIEGYDADALGFEPEKRVDTEQHKVLDEYIKVSDNDIEARLKECFDPEIPVNVLDLGLIYQWDVVSNQEEKTNLINLTMTLTAPACSMGPVLISDIKAKLLSILGVTDVKIELVFDPPWDREMMSDEAKIILGMY